MATSFPCHDPAVRTFTAIAERRGSPVAKVAVAAIGSQELPLQGAGYLDLLGEKHPGIRAMRANLGRAMILSAAGDEACCAPFAGALVDLKGLGHKTHQHITRRRHYAPSSCRGQTNTASPPGYDEPP
jgi:hypothetical protein